MIRELVELGKKIRKNHDALKEEPIDIDLIITEDGSFEKFSVIERIYRPAEALNAKKGKARLLLDKAEEVLGYINNEFLEKKNKLLKQGKSEQEAYEIVSKSVESKHKLFLEKLNEYKNLQILKPVFLFFYDNKKNGIDKALEEFEKQVSEKYRKGNIAFRIKDIRLHEQPEVYNAIIDKYEKSQIKKLKENKKKCSICGKSDYPITEEPHGKITGIPGGNSSGCALISYNEDAYESYNLSRNLNSSICTNCAKNYMEALNHLIKNYIEQPNEKSSKKYTNRKNLGPDTAIVFWTKEPENCQELDLFDKPDPGEVINLIESVENAKTNISSYFESNQFYSITLSGSASRIIIRDWIEVGIEEYRKNIVYWFKDLAIKYYDKNSKELKTFFPSIYQLIKACEREESEEKTISSRIANILWRCALKNQKPQLWILTILLKRIAHNSTNKEGKFINTFTDSRASLIKFILKRNNHGGLHMVKEELDLENKTPAYLCGRLFALIESIQRLALGNEINAGVRERFFSAASSCPAPTFGRLIRLMQNHLTKIRQEKPGLATSLEKEVVEICSHINNFPATLTLEEQGIFALGYYHQKQYNFLRAKQNKEFELLNENMEESENE